MKSNKSLRHINMTDTELFKTMITLWYKRCISIINHIINILPVAEWILHWLWQSGHAIIIFKNNSDRNLYLCNWGCVLGVSLYNSYTVCKTLVKWTVSWLDFPLFVTIISTQWKITDNTRYSSQWAHFVPDVSTVGIQSSLSPCNLHDNAFVFLRQHPNGMPPC